MSNKKNVLLFAFYAWDDIRIQPYGFLFNLDPLEWNEIDNFFTIINQKQ